MTGMLVIFPHKNAYRDAEVNSLSSTSGISPFGSSEDFFGSTTPFKIFLKSGIVSSLVWGKVLKVMDLFFTVEKCIKNVNVTLGIKQNLVWLLAMIRKVLDRVLCLGLFFGDWRRVECLRCLVAPYPLSPHFSFFQHDGGNQRSIVEVTMVIALASFLGFGMVVLVSSVLIDVRLGSLGNGFWLFWILRLIEKPVVSFDLPNWKVGFLEKLPTAAVMLKLLAVVMKRENRVVTTKAFNIIHHLFHRDSMYSRESVPRAVLMKSGLVSVNTARQVNVAHTKTTANAAKPMSYLSKTAHSTIKGPIHKNTTFKNSNFNQRVNIVKDKNVNIIRPKAVVNVAKPKAVVNVGRPKAVVNVVKGNNVNVVKASACWVWKLVSALDRSFKPVMNIEH
ncbi:hypothetical protein Tco_0383591 [Tanacetum coccineum]